MIVYDFFFREQLENILKNHFSLQCDNMRVYRVALR